jgi:branched-chain amino acid aminotransferase
VKEEALSIKTITEGTLNGKLTEIFGSGTAASIAPVGCLHYSGSDFIVNEMEVGPIAKQLYDQVIGIQYGLKEDTYGWIVRVI